MGKIYKRIKKVLIIGCGGAEKACIVSTKNKYPKAKILSFLIEILEIKKIYQGNKNLIKNIKIIKNNKILRNLKNLDLIINTTLGFDLEIPQIKSNYKFFTPILFEDLRFDQLETLENVKNKISENLIDTFYFLHSKF